MKYVIEFNGVSLYPKMEFIDALAAKEWFLRVFNTRDVPIIRSATKDYRIAYGYTTEDYMITTAENSAQAQDYAVEHLKSCGYANFVILSVKEESTKD
jgi:hypothetical protein